MGTNFRVFSTLEQCLSASYDVESLNGRPLSMLDSLWEKAYVFSVPRKDMPASISDWSITHVTPIFDSALWIMDHAFTGLILAARFKG